MWGGDEESDYFYYVGRRVSVFFNYVGRRSCFYFNFGDEIDFYLLCKEKRELFCNYVRSVVMRVSFFSFNYVGRRVRFLNYVGIRGRFFFYGRRRGSYLNMWWRDEFFFVCGVECGVLFLLCDEEREFFYYV